MVLELWRERTRARGWEWRPEGSNESERFGTPPLHRVFAGTRGPDRTCGLGCVKLLHGQRLRFSNRICCSFGHGRVHSGQIGRVARGHTNNLLELHLCHSSFLQ